MLANTDLRSETNQVIVRELPADLDTPVSIYLKLTQNTTNAAQTPSFLLESVSGGENLARYSFIGANPSRTYVLRGRSIEIRSNDGQTTLSVPDGQSPLACLRSEMERCRRPALPGLPRFSGGLVGYMGYEMVRFFEPSVALDAHPSVADAIFLQVDTLVAFDHAFGKMVLISNYDSQQTSRAEAEARLDELQALIARPLLEKPAANGNRVKAKGGPLQSNMTQAQYEEAVRKAKEYIAAGDIFQVVLSQRLERVTSAEPFNIYRALRRLNPSPYMFYMDFGQSGGGEPLRLIGASPEMHTRLEGERAIIRPIAGTRPRGKSTAEDAALEIDLLADPKELAEHVMLVDLARNDLGRVCEYGSVHVTEQLAVERYSHVMHIVSQAEGRLQKYDAFDLLQATFPAGTVSGAPKIRAMQIIDELESSPRGAYAGVAGYIAFDGSMDTCITIRTLMMQGQTISVQAGAGIVADSEPEKEYQESMNKARALAVSIEMAE